MMLVRNTMPPRTTSYSTEVLLQWPRDLLTRLSNSSCIPVLFMATGTRLTWLLIRRSRRWGAVPCDVAWQMSQC